MIYGTLADSGLYLAVPAAFNNLNCPFSQWESTPKPAVPSAGDYCVHTYKKLMHSSLKHWQNPASHNEDRVNQSKCMET